MSVYIEEFVISCKDVKKEYGEIYENIGLDVQYDSASIKICSSSRAKIKSICDGIHIHALYRSVQDLKDTYSPLEMKDKLGNKITVTFIGDKTHNSIGIITSGGDAPGMNSAIRSIVRTGIKMGSSVFGVYRGYDGLINDFICELGWDTETHNSSEGGTVLLSFRSKSFIKRDIRKKAVYNLVKRGINSLIILGGDGSLTGALVLKQEFKELFRELIKEGKFDKNDLIKNLKRDTSMVDNFDEFYGEPECYKEIPKMNLKRFETSSNANLQYEKDDSCKSSDKQKCDETPDINEPLIKQNDTMTRLVEPLENDEDDIEDYMYDLKIVGIPASIDNDIYEADYTLGADTAMNRVIEAIDHLSSTMRSHQRIFVIEVMGRTCGWLSLMSAFSCLADYVFIPEDPPFDWKQDVIENIEFGRKHGKPGMFIIISEGAIDQEGKKICSSDVVDYIKSMNIDVRLLKLGHIQRGGPTSAFDRILGTLSGIKAVEELYNSDLTPKVIIYKDGDLISLNMEDIIGQNEKIKKYEANLEFESILKSRGNLFRTIHGLYKSYIETKKQSKAPLMEDINLRLLVEDNVSLKNKYKKENEKIQEENKPNKKIGILQCGNRASGMNTALNSIVQYCYVKNIEPYYILNGFDGLLNDQIIKAQLYEFSNDFNNGGSLLGLGSVDNISKSKIREQIKKHQLDSLIIIGDADCLTLLNDLCDINIILIPSATSNNIPCTDISIGTDTSLNTIIKVSDCAKLNTYSLKNNVFVLEISGDYCGFLTLMAGIAAGSFECFIPERKYLISHLSETAHRLRLRFKKNKRSGIVIFRNERTFCSIPTESFCRVLRTDGKGLFSTDYSVLGRLQQGITPSPIDRINATLFGFKAVEFCLDHQGVGVIGLNGNRVVFNDIKKVLDSFDTRFKVTKHPKWIKYSGVCKSLE